MNRILLIVSVVLATLTGCSNTNKLSSSERAVEKRNEVANAIESGSYVIRVNQMTGKFGVITDLVPSYNFIVIKNNHIARISLGYLGRSYDIMQITGINMEGKIDESTYDTNKNGMHKISMRVTENNDTFNVNISVSLDGYCNVGIVHPRIDYVNYRGQLSEPGRYNRSK